MKCTIEKEIIEENLALASRFISHRLSAVQSIQGVRLEVKDGSLSIISTNLGDYFYTVIPVTSAQDGCIVCDIKKTLEFLSFLRTGAVELSFDESVNALTVTQGKTRGTFNIYNKDDFPGLPDVSGTSFALDPAFLASLPAVFLAASKDETRPVMTGIYIAQTDQEMVCVSTDGFRLSLLKAQKIDAMTNIILPVSIMQEVVRLSGKGTQVSMSISAKERLVKFTMGQATIYSRIIEGEFPPYEKVIPQESSTSVSFDAQDCTKNIRLISVFARDEADVVILDISESGIVLYPKSSSKKNSEAFQDITSFEGNPLKIAFNYKYLLDYFNNASGVVTMRCTLPTAPALFTSEASEAFMHIIMPLRTEETDN